jgi:asparagine synthase (glutamine-hydrolysing)
VARWLQLSAIHVERNLDYTRKAVYNNHLLSEAFGLLLAGTLLPKAPQSAHWAQTGRDLLTKEADAQVYADGAYIQQSHNYQRVAAKVYLWAAALLRKAGDPVPTPWFSAMERSLDFLVAHQNPADGRLPNYGSNDGAQPSILSTCDFSDFRPVLQALSVLTRGRRLYEPGPWDEECAWLLGPESLDVPLEPTRLRSVSFDRTGYHVLRGNDPASFAAFRCGTVRDRFSQIDMLNLDVWWRGQNVLVDPGSYLYNGPRRWHEHFVGTESHNTVAIDGRDQMFHYRRFKSLYWTRAELLAFADENEFSLCEGEHSGYARHPGGCVHRRAVLFAKDDLWVVVDRISGNGEHQARLHWLGGDYPWSYQSDQGALELSTPAGPFAVTVLDEEGRPAGGDVVAGVSDPPRGWLSRYYGEKRPVPSLAVERAGALPLVLVSILAPERPQVTVAGSRWTVRAAGLGVSFDLDEGRFRAVTLEAAEPARRISAP